MGKVPALMDETPEGTVYMADSAPICLYLSDRYPSAGLAPAVDHPSRGKFLYWMNYTPGVIEPAMMEKFVGFEVEPGSCGWGSYVLMMKVLEEALKEGPWVMGDNFTAADVLLGSSVYFMKMFKLLEDNPVLDAYAERCLARPAYQAALARDVDLN
jgi:glutathione S-transferase